MIAHKDRIIEQKDQQAAKANEVIQDFSKGKSSTKVTTEATVEKIDKGKRKRTDDTGSKVM